MPSLANEIRQLFAHSTLEGFQRLEQADIQFTFKAGDVYLSSFFESINRVDVSGFREHDPALLSYAQVFDRFLAHPSPVIKPLHTALASSSFYWLSGYSANALVIARAIRKLGNEHGRIVDLLLRILARDPVTPPTENDHPVYALYFDYIANGDAESLKRAIEAASELAEQTLSNLDSDEHVAAYLLAKVLARLRHVGFWEIVSANSSAAQEAWHAYAAAQMDTGTPLIDLWPSQRLAISRGLLDGTSSLLVRTPTSSGKTKMSELAFVNDLFTYPDRKCLYLAPYRALVGEVEREIGSSLSRLGIPTASLYGGAEANELEVDLANIARVVIATPEKIQAVHRLSGGSLADFGTVVLDEGHLIDDLTRGASYELQLSDLRRELVETGRAVFISAVLPNPSELAAWLTGSSESLAEDAWQPTTMRIGVVTWPQGSSASLRYVVQTGQPVTDGFFVPRLIDEDVWQEVNPATGRLRTHRFPKQDDKGSIAAALAFQFASSGPVILFTSRPDWANSIVRKIVERSRLERPMPVTLKDEGNADQLQMLSDYVGNVVGEDSDLPSAISLGVGLHHGGIPQNLRLVIEDEYRRGNIRILVATNTIAQGVNFPAKTIVVHSYPRTDSPVRDFWNLTGRAGRALRETEGEVVLLDTGDPKPWQVRRFIDPANAEPAESQILYLIERLLETYPRVSEESLARLLLDEVEGADFANTIRAIDLHLLEVMAEDVALDEVDDDFRILVENLFASHQARWHDLEYATYYRQAVDDLLTQRRRSVLERVPVGNRRRYARTSISIESSIALDDASEALVAQLPGFPQISQDGTLFVLELLANTVELSDQNMEELALLSYRWVRTGSYSEVFRAIDGKFKSHDQAVAFVERELGYRLPWVTNGFLRLLETNEDFVAERAAGRIPLWFTLLPQYLQYGVDNREMMWAMSMGIADRNFAAWLLRLFGDQLGRQPESFRELVSWVRQSSDELLAICRVEWPPYFATTLRGIVERYSRLEDQLGA